MRNIRKDQRAPIRLSWLAAITVAGQLLAAPAAEHVALTDQSMMHFATLEQAREWVTQEDDFIRALGPFDRSARLKCDEPVTQEKFLAHVRAQPRAWTDGERKQVTMVINALRDKIAHLNLRLPPDIYLVKTTGQEEGGAAHCRGVAIVLPETVLNTSLDRLEGLITHELFHIYTTHHPDRLAELYAIVGFRWCEDIPLPDSLRPYKITNPDAPRLNMYIEVDVEGELIPVTPVLLSRASTYNPNDEDTFLGYLQRKLLVLKLDSGRATPRLRANGQPWLLDEQEVPDYERRTHLNTGYIIHPEEILAENFRLLVLGHTEVPSPEVMTALYDALIK